MNILYTIRRAEQGQARPIPGGGAKLLEQRIAE